MNSKDEISEAQDRKGFAVAGLVISIISIILVAVICMIPFFVLLIPPLVIALIGLIALVLSIIGLKLSKKRRIAIAGIVLSSLIILLMLFWQLLIGGARIVE